MAIDSIKMELECNQIENEIERAIVVDIFGNIGDAVEDVTGGIKQILIALLPIVGIFRIYYSQSGIATY